MNDTALRALRLQRNHLIEPVETTADYDALFRRMSPCRTAYWCAPGSPPTIAHAVAFDDSAYTDSLRARRALMKGRFQNGGVAYVFRDDLVLFAAAYRKDPSRLTEAEQNILRLLRQEGPMSIGMMKELTGWLVKQLTPVLHKLQEKFLVFEDQADSEGDRAWYLFEEELPDVDLSQWTREAAIAEILQRFAYLHGFFTLAMAKSYYGLPARELQKAVDALCADGVLQSVEWDGEKGYVRVSDLPLLESPAPVPQSVFCFHRNAFLIKSLEPILQGRWQREGCDLLFYLCIDGAIAGAVVGHLHNGPFDLEDVVLDLPPEEAVRRRAEILHAIYQVNNPAASPLRRYCGQEG